MPIYQVEGWYSARLRFVGEVRATSAREAARLARDSMTNVEVWATESEVLGPNHIRQTVKIADDDEG